MEIYNKRPVKPPKNPPGRQPIHTLEYMMMVAEKVVKKELTYREAGKMFGISHGTIGTWVKQYRSKNWGKNNRAANRAVSEEVHKYRHESQVKELKHEIAELYLENLMLKKMVQYSQSIKKENSSVITSENLDQFKKAAKS
jgi:transposase